MALKWILSSWEQILLEVEEKPCSNPGNSAHVQTSMIFREHMHLSAVLAQAHLQIEIPSGELS